PIHLDLVLGHEVRTILRGTRPLGCVGSQEARLPTMLTQIEIRASTNGRRRSTPIPRARAARHRLAGAAWIEDPADVFVQVELPSAELVWSATACDDVGAPRPLTPAAGCLSL